jgi:predicted transposase YbfD/YdcC
MYFLCNIEATLEEFAYAVREHWEIESIYWSLDVTFTEDSKRVRKENAPENLALL